MYSFVGSQQATQSTLFMNPAFLYLTKIHKLPLLKPSSDLQVKCEDKESSSSLTAVLNESLSVDALHSNIQLKLLSCRESKTSF